MYYFLLFVHIIAGAVYFGLPFTFARWFRTTAAEGGSDALQRVVGKLKMYCNVHLNITALVVLGSGLYLTTHSGLWGTVHWPHAAALLLLTSLVNLRLNLGSALRQQLATSDEEVLTRALHTRKRISVFEAVHHTLVTLIIALMVFRPF